MKHQSKLKHLLNCSLKIMLRNRSNKQLYSIVPEMQMCNYFHIKSKAVFTREADNMPFLCFPNEVPCLMANLYMIKLFKKGLSRKGRGGTLKQYAANISHLIRHCYYRNKEFIALNDSEFVQFIDVLRNEVDPKYPDIKKRDSNTLNNIGRSCLDFLSYVGEFHDDEEFIINSIRAEKKSITIKAERAAKGSIQKEYWHHHSFDTPDSKKKRSPIAKDTIKKLYESVSTVSDSKFLYRRRTVMIRLLEMTGARIGEISLLKTQDVLAALASKTPLLKLTTLKKKKETFRYLPVLKQDLMVLKKHIKIYRSRVIKNSISEKNDHDFLFIGEKSGLPISSRYMGNEIGILRRAANIEAKACAHMFRHRFITKLFVTLISQYELENKDDFRRALLDVNILKMKVKEYTGHSDNRSIDHYIDMAFQEITNFKKVIDSRSLKEAYDAFDEHLDKLNQELDSGMPPQEYLENLNLLKAMRDDDIERLSKEES